MLSNLIENYHNNIKSISFDNVASVWSREAQLQVVPRGSRKGGNYQNGNVKGIYDLQGRKINEITQPGIYIVDGEKVRVR